MKKLIFVLALLGLSCGNAHAHSGRTDSDGGHWNRVDYVVPVYESHRY